ncbi:MAG: hypothetical protein DHS20C11_17150 [Lysobacteraceae bacterium]|nr:MAG: hypothetical protein DHS20C11_17150 [Xanthomonadaceae bacterium]
MPAGAEPGQASVETHGVYVDAGAHGGGVLKVTGPNNFQFEQKVGPGQSAFLDLNVLKGLGVEDGGYRYELVVSPAMSETQKAMLADLRELGDTAQIEDMRKEGLMPAPMAPMTGFFTIDQGQIADPNLVEITASDGEQKGVGDGSGANKDQQILDDLIVDGSACIGQDCVNGESFGFDTIRIKENNLRIKAQDTSSTASFPTVDWQLTFNESSNGGANKFSIDDIDGGRTPFTIEANAPSHSLYVDDGGRIGLGKSTPVVELHITDGDTPTVRLEQDGSSGFTPQTWDMAGNETNWFVRDATNGSTLPLRIRPSAGSNSIYVDTDSDIGFGTSSPGNIDSAFGLGGTDASVHVSRNDGTAALLIEDTSGTAAERVLFEMKSNGGQAMLFRDSGDNSSWLFNQNTANAFAISSSLTAGNQMVLQSDGDVVISGEFFSTTCTTPCAPDYVFEPGYKLLPLSDVRDFIDDNGHLPNMPSAQELVGPMNMSAMQMRLLEKVEELTLYTLQQEDTIAELTNRLEKLEDK